MIRIDLNADVGESFGAYKIGDDAALFPHITSANIACGMHAGDYNVMNETVLLAKKYGVAVGVHPGFPDLQGFGRREWKMAPMEIYHCLIYQIGALKAFCDLHEVPISHVKPHGALYNLSNREVDVAKAIVKAVGAALPHSILFALSGSLLHDEAEKIGLNVAKEVFADRMYTEEGLLADRSHPHAVLHSLDEMEAQVKSILFDQQVIAMTGEAIPMQADTICFHGDGYEVASRVSYIRSLLDAHGVVVKAVGAK